VVAEVALLELAAGRCRDPIRNALAQLLPAPAGGLTYPKAASPAG